MRRSLLLLSSLGLLIACPSGNDDDSAGAGDDDDAAADITPEEGTWNLTLGGALAQDSCDFFPGAGSGDSLGTSELTLSTDAGVDFVMVDSDDQIFDCTISGSSYSCVARALVLPGDPLIPDYEVTRTGTRSGNLSSATSMTFVAVNTDECEGVDCGTVEQVGNAQGPYSFPCVFEFSGTASK